MSERARTLRKSMTESERRLWWALRKRQIDGARFRRQHPIGPYVADFICLERGLVVEVDGDHHAEAAQLDHDERRTRWLDAEGYAVVRVWNRDVLNDLDGVLATIYGRLKERPIRARGPTPT